MIHRLRKKIALSSLYGSVSAPSHIHHGQEEPGRQPDHAQRGNSITVDHPPRGSSIASGVVNLSNTILGAGILGIPGAIAGTGWLTGIVLIALSASFSAHGLVLLSKAAFLTGRPSSFYSVALASVPKFTILIDLAVALKCFGVATGYLITISDSMVNALDHMILTGDSAKDERILIYLLLSRHFWVVGAIVSVLPFSFYRTLDELKKASAMALVFVFMLVGMIIGYAFYGDPCRNEDGDDCRGVVVPYTDLPLTLSKFPIFVFAFTCHQNIFPIVNEIELVSQYRLNIVICCSIGFAFVVFSVVALAGYRTYGSFVMGDILLNYPETGLVTLLRVCIAFMLTLHYPLQLDPSRRCITSLVKVIMKWWHGEQPKGGNSSPKALPAGHPDEVEMEQKNSPNAAKESPYYEMSNNSEKQHTAGKDEDKLFYIITLSFLSLSFMLAIIVDDLGVVLAMVGATGSTLVSYVLPGLLYVRVYQQMDLSKVMAYIQLGVGIVIIPVALYFAITQQTSH